MARAPEGADALLSCFAAKTLGDLWPISAPPAGMAARMAAFMASASGALPGIDFVAGSCASGSLKGPEAGTGASAGEDSTAVGGACCSGACVSGRVKLPLGKGSVLFPAGRGPCDGVDTCVSEGGAGRGPVVSAHAGAPMQLPATRAIVSARPARASGVRRTGSIERLFIFTSGPVPRLSGAWCGLRTSSGAGACAWDQRPAPNGLYPNILKLE